MPDGRRHHVFVGEQAFGPSCPRTRASSSHRRCGIITDPAVYWIIRRSRCPGEPEARPGTDDDNREACAYDG